MFKKKNKHNKHKYRNSLLNFSLMKITGSNVNIFIILSGMYRSFNFNNIFWNVQQKCSAVSYSLEMIMIHMNDAQIL